MLLKHGRICSRVLDKSLNLPNQLSRTNPTCHFSVSSPERSQHGSLQPYSPSRLQRLHRGPLHPALVGARKGLHTSSKLFYSRGTDSEKAREFLQRYHDKTMRKYGVSQDGKDRDVTSLQTSSQVRVIPRFLLNAQMFNGRHYFCHLDSTTDSKELIRFRMSRDERLVLSENLDKMSEVRELAHSGKYLAILVSSDQNSNIFVIEEETGAVIKTLEQGHQLQWISETQLVYTTINNNMRPDTAHYCDIQTGETVQIHASSRDKEVVSVTCSKDKQCIVVHVNTKLTSHVCVYDNHTLRAGGGGGAESVVCSRNLNVKCYIEHHKDRLIAIASSDSNPDLHLYWSDPINKTADTEPDYPTLETFTPHPDDFGVIHELEAFDRGVVVYHTTLDGSGRRGNYRATLLDPDDYTKTISVIDFPADVSLVTPNSNTSPDQTHLKICVHSYTKPMKQLTIPFSKFGVSRGRLISRGRYEMISDTVSSGETNVPITIIAQEDSLLEKTPCLFITYGCYGENLFYSWETLPRELLDKGWKVVLCHVRGGGELGRSWYLQGVEAEKEKTVLDTLNCIKDIQSRMLTTPSLSTLHASSSGALIAARAVQSVPGIVGKLVLRFPFLDLHTAMSDTSLPLFSEEQEEWGYDSEGRGSGLAPLDFRGAPSYTEVFVTVAGRDRRAPCWHAANFISSILNEEKVNVNFLEDADHTGFVEEADTVETSFILSNEGQKGGGLWNRLKESLFSK